MTRGTEERGTDEVEQRVVQPRLVQVDVLRMPFGDVRRTLVRGLTGVVGRGPAMVPPHAKPTDAAVQEPAIQVVRARGWARVGGGDVLTRSRVGASAHLHRVVLVARDDRRMRGLVGGDCISDADARTEPATRSRPRFIAETCVQFTVLAMGQMRSTDTPQR